MTLKTDPAGRLTQSTNQHELANVRLDDRRMSEDPARWRPTTLKVSVERRKRIVVAAVLVIVLLITALSVFARAHFIENRSLAGRLDGQEPEAHILVTVTAFNEVDWTIHKFLPIFTYSARYNKYIDQHPGAATPDIAGNYFYTSTPPLTFVVPWLFSKVVNADPSIALFRWYNVALQLAASLSLGALVLLCLQRSGADQSAALLASSCAVVIYMTAPK